MYSEKGITRCIKVLGAESGQLCESMAAQIPRQPHWELDCSFNVNSVNFPAEPTQLYLKYVLIIASTHQNFFQLLVFGFLVLYREISAQNVKCHKKSRRNVVHTSQ